MAVSDYSSLKQYLINRMARDDYTDTEAAEDIAFAEAVFNRNLRTRQEISDPVTLTMVPGTKTYDFPATFYALNSIGYTDGGDLKQVPAQELASYDQTPVGKPVRFSIGNKTITFAYAPDGDYELEYTYFGKFTPLSGSNTTNWILADFNDVYADSALYHAFKRFRDARALDFRVLMQDGIAEINQADRADSLSSGMLVMQHNVDDTV